MIYEFLKKCGFDNKSIIFEIGSHMGFDSEKIHSLTNNSILHCFEPDPRNIAILKERELDKKFILNELAISNIDGYSEFYLSSGKIPDDTGNSFYNDNDWSASSSLRAPEHHLNVYPWCEFNEKIQITSTTLDSYCKTKNINHISFIWMDVQGCEDLVINGGLNALSKTEYLYTEYSNDNLYQDQKCLNDLLEMLPGKWEKKFDIDNNILLENLTFRETLINENGSWDTKNSNDHVFDEDLANSIVELCKSNKIESIVDFGCGEGKYFNLFKSNGFDCSGYDGNLNTEDLTNGLCSRLLLNKPFNLKRKFDIVMSLEVGEHMPEKYELVFIKNLIKHTSKKIILSWAIVGQGGYGHVNCKSNEYIKSIFIQNGFVCNEEEENKLRESAFNSWFKNTIMVFDKI